jgi:hypothetical protein
MPLPIRSRRPTLDDMTDRTPPRQSPARLVALALLLAAAGLAAHPAGAQDRAPERTPERTPENAPSTGTDRSLLSACLRENLSSPRACIGTVAVPCVRQAPGGIRTDAEIACARREATLWRERLDAASGAFAQTMDSGQRSRFAALQRSWEAYTAQKCAFLGEMQQPVRMAAMQAGCDLQEIASRAIEIERAMRTRQGPSRSQRNQPPRIER